MHIIVKKSGESKRFSSHYNIALGKYIATESEYVRELKSKNLEPYDKNYKEPEPKMYKPSKRAHEITSAIQKRTNKDGSVTLNKQIMDEIGAHLPKKQKKYGQIDISTLDTKGGFK